MASICVVDYGIGNIFSAMKGLRRFTQNVILSEDAGELRSASALVLPGQGAFEAGMEGLRVRGLLPAVLEAAAHGKPILGICLGAQILLGKGFEFGEWEGLGLLPGKVVHFPSLQNGAKTPHMGWNSIHPPSGSSFSDTMLDGVAPESEMYFIHSFILEPDDPSHVQAVTTYGGLSFASAVGKGAILGCQFHPEKSGEAGLRILQNFVAQADARA